ncbi:hypothetical protein SAMN05444287_1532 [Octadecabacter temperatus]|uniref:Uncharacterized protein n=1 Tax=Octadecabacter temperatus TaxID=1458307 RepID=A0A0K0Y691_9RHOB|nr:hypothetical protein OSB_18760 [Octadecabacter temperatus]SIO13593.1 hypothetical protein SAMN05444287_1532 [Octadecabacter temperatus]
MRQPIERLAQILSVRLPDGPKPTARLSLLQREVQQVCKIRNNPLSGFQVRMDGPTKPDEGRTLS